MSKEEVAKDHHTICKIYGGTGRTRIHVPMYGNKDFYRQYEILVELSDGTQLIIWVSEEEFYSIEREIKEGEMDGWGNKTSLEKYKYFMEGEEESDPIERLRFFLSIALSGQDWLDVEQFLDDIKEETSINLDIVKWTLKK